MGESKETVDRAVAQDVAPRPSLEAILRPLMEASRRLAAPPAPPESGASRGWITWLTTVLAGCVAFGLMRLATGLWSMRGLLGRSRPLGRAWYELTGGHVAYTTAACVIAAGVVGFPLLVEAIRLAMLGVDRRLELVSRSLGRGRLATFLRVTLPLSLPGLLAGAVLSFARALGEFGATIVLAGNVEGETRTIPVAVYTLLNVRGGEAAVLRLTLVSVALALAALIGSFWLSARQRLREVA